MPAHVRHTNRTRLGALAPLIVAVGIGALAASPALTRAADALSAQTYICHAAGTGETPNARMTGSAATALSCHLVVIEARMSNGSLHTIGRVGTKMMKAPDYSSALTPAQINDAWVKFIDTAFSVNHSP
jgi:hypothetical protein